MALVKAHLTRVNHWHLPEVLAIPMAHHHRPQTLEDSTVKDVAQIVWLAGRVVSVLRWFVTKMDGAGEPSRFHILLPRPPSGAQ